MRSIELLRVGDGVREDALNELMRGLKREFGAQVGLRPGIIDPQFAFDSRRNQYYSSAILQSLSKVGSRSRLLGVTGVDLYVPVLTFVFGEAQLEGLSAVVSCHRLEETYYGMPERVDLTAERLLKESVHELGHTFGLRHCTNWECVMASSHSVERLDIKSQHFCLRCRAMVDQDWPRAWEVAPGPQRFAR